MIQVRHQEKERPEHRRLRLLAAFGVLLWLGVSGRLMQVQALKHEDYLTRARDQQQRQVEIKANRGSIFDRSGRELAVDLRSTSFYAHPTQVREKEKVARHFARLGRHSAEELERLLRSGRPFIYLERQLDDAQRDQMLSQTFEGVYNHPETRRYYPLGQLAGQVVGHTNIDNRGNDGLEWAFDEVLRERNGAALSFVDARGRQVPGKSQQQQSPEDGRSLVLTIDVVYQDILEEELERTVRTSRAESGMGLITDPRTGEILAMANVPLYDPNNAASTQARSRRNRTVTDAYEPGSTFKIVAAAAALEDGLAKPEERIFCENGRLVLDHGDVIRDPHPHGELSFREVLEKSSNIGIIKVSRRLKRQRFYEYIRRFGFAMRTSIELPAESQGHLRPPDTWSERSQETITIGQEVSITPLQLAMAYGAIANGGKLMAPRIVRAVVGEDGSLEEKGGPQVLRQIVSPQTAATLRQILAGAVASGTGTKAQVEGVAVAGKTGTAQRASASGRGYDPSATIVSFAGFLPAEEAQLLCLIIVENPLQDKWGGTIAAPAFKRVMERILYLPGGLLVKRQTPQEEASGEVARVPDLRGMNRKVARFQAGLRGLPVVFAGEGDLVVGQEPPPGPGVESAAGVTCTLSVSSALPEGGIEGMPLRQARALEALGTEPMATLR